MIYTFVCAVCHEQRDITYPATPMPPVVGEMYRWDIRLYPCRYGGVCQFTCTDERTNDAPLYGQQLAPADWPRKKG